MSPKQQRRQPLHARPAHLLTQLRGEMQSSMVVPPSAPAAKQHSLSMEVGRFMNAAMAVALDRSRVPTASLEVVL